MAISKKQKEEVHAYFQGRCAYCRNPNALIFSFFEMDHILPTSQGGTDATENLALSCPLCNRFKRNQTHGTDPITNRRVALFHPRRQNWFRHFAWSEDYLTIIGKTACGRVTVEAIGLNGGQYLRARRAWLENGYLPPNWE